MSQSIFLGEGADVTMDLRAYLRAFRRSWWVLALTLALGAGAGAALVLASTPLYASSVTFFVRTITNNSTNLQESNQYAQQRVASYAQLITSERLASMVVDATQVPLTPRELQDQITSSANVDTVLLKATVTDPSPAQSLKLATGIGTEFVTLLKSLDPAVSLEVVSGPTLDPQPVSPKKTVDIGLGIAVGLAVGLSIAVMRETLDSTVRTSAALSTKLGLSDLGQIPNDMSAKKAPLVTQDHAHSMRAEALRQVRTNLQFTRVDNPPQAILVTSPLPGEGKSTTAINLALIFAETNRRVLLLEGDLRRPGSSRYLDIESSMGLTNVLAGQADLADVIQPWISDALDVLPCGAIPPNPSELLGSESMASLMTTVRSTYDLIIIDAPPVLPVTDAAVLSRHADGVVLLTRYGKTKVQQATAAVKALRAVDAAILGCVINMMPERAARAYLSYVDFLYTGAVDATSLPSVPSIAAESKEQAARGGGTVIVEPSESAVVEPGESDIVEPDESALASADPADPADPATTATGNNGAPEARNGHLDSTQSPLARHSATGEK